MKFLRTIENIEKIIIFCGLQFKNRFRRILRRIWEARINDFCSFLCYFVHANFVGWARSLVLGKLVLKTALGLQITEPSLW